VTDKLNWLTDSHRDYLAYLTVITIRPQLRHAHSHDDVADALGELADEGKIRLLGDQENIWVLIDDQVIVHAARDWLDDAVAREATRKLN
jgi:ribosomal silencing factor RsfS